MFTVYVLKSISADWFYVGMTTDFDRRLSDHNRGYNLSTKSKAPFLVIFTEVYNTSLEARKREKFLKMLPVKYLLESILIRINWSE